MRLPPSCCLCPPLPRAPPDRRLAPCADQARSLCCLLSSLVSVAADLQAAPPSWCLPWWCMSSTAWWTTWTTRSCTRPSEVRYRAASVVPPRAARHWQGALRLGIMRGRCAAAVCQQHAVVLLRGWRRAALPPQATGLRQGPWVASGEKRPASTRCTLLLTSSVLPACCRLRPHPRAAGHPPAKGLEEGQIAALPEVQLTAEGIAGLHSGACPVCLDAFEPGEAARCGGRGRGTERRGT
jgi:hypothetical protein